MLPSAFLPLSPLPPSSPPAAHTPVCKHASPPPADDAVHAAHRLARGETITLLQRMLAVAVADEDYTRAAAVRDAQRALQRQHPTFLLRGAEARAARRGHFAEAARLRDEVARLEMLAMAERCKPRFPMGLVVRHRRLGYRMVLFGADCRCRVPQRKAEDAGVCLSWRGEEQPWYHAAVDERDKKTGDNVVYVAEDDCVPVEGGVTVQHPITTIMFRGVHEQAVCPGYSCTFQGSGTLPLSDLLSSPFVSLVASALLSVLTVSAPRLRASPTMSAVTVDSIRARLNDDSALSPLTHVDVVDTSGGCGQSFAVTAVSAAFKGVPLLQRHRMMHAALKSVIEQIHAVTFKCLTPDKFVPERA